MPVPPYINPGALSRFKQFELIAHSVVEGLLTGQHRSPYKGFAIEFAAHRPYSPGDDLKHLDWKLVGKLNRYYIRQYEEDTSLNAYLLLDTSGSMGYRSDKYSKFDLGRFICAVLACVLQQQQDSVGMITFDSRIRHQLPPRSTRPHFKAVLDLLGTVECGDDTGLGDVLHSLAKRLKRRALIVIVSDFFDDRGRIVRALNHFAHRKHEVVAFQVLDPQEEEFNFTEQTRFQSMESEHSVMTDPIRIRREYLRRLREHNTELRRACHKLQIDLNCFRTDCHFESTMARYLAKRLKQ